MNKFYYMSITHSKIEVQLINDFYQSDINTPLSVILKESKNTNQIKIKEKIVNHMPDFIFPVEDFVPLVTFEILESLNMFSEEYTSIKTEIEDINKNYYLLNINNIFECINWKDTNYIEIPLPDKDINIRIAIPPITIVKEKVKGNLFKIFGWSTYPVVSQEVKEILCKYDLTGITFTEIISA